VKAAEKGARLFDAQVCRYIFIQREAALFPGSERDAVCFCTPSFSFSWFSLLVIPDADRLIKSRPSSQTLCVLKAFVILPQKKRFWRSRRRTKEFRQLLEGRVFKRRWQLLFVSFCLLLIINSLRCLHRLFSLSFFSRKDLFVL
jgi:hypothetical protein